MFESWELLVRDSVSHHGTSIPGPFKATAKAIEDLESWRWAEWSLYYKVLVDQCRGTSQEIMYFTGKPLSFQRKYYNVKKERTGIFLYVIDIPSQNS